ncbi:Conserved virulence factor B [Alloiococcus otitis]|uniref:S1 motif domain-containing protein n=1 Tax=Alloiococcus otitis ATCC 51267 TaxID=883081 RepID=K9EAG2_9LACT|nr:S1-like domain-containing RNA-binding protein [Alloiococcus otitis]EKU94229.1 hypothetical protein HMPREF9698_00261 [Alloiococcus otitis ATCC 51267]SUU81137.1 Conserved virulence factor B [Alloiococcus otitis]
MKDLGKIVKALIVDQVEGVYLAQKEGETYEVKSDKPLQLGQTVDAFAYLNQDKQKVMTVDLPIVSLDDYGWARVVDRKRGLGVFVDIGLEDKDIAISLDDLPEEVKYWPKKDDQVYINLWTDKKDRLWGKLASPDLFKTMTNKGTASLHNNDVTGRVLDLKAAGDYLITGDNYLAYLPQTEKEEETRLGQEVKGRIIGLREDGVLYLSTKPRAHEVIDEDAQMIYAAILRSPNQAIPYHDKSDPQAIRDYFGISKGQFKRAVGHLMKDNLVAQDQEKTYLLHNKNK